MYVHVYKALCQQCAKSKYAQHAEYEGDLANVQHETLTTVGVRRHGQEAALDPR